MLAECTVKKFIKLWHYAKVHRNLNDFWGILKIILLMCFWFARELLELTLFFKLCSLHLLLLHVLEKCSWSSTRSGLVASLV